MSSDSPSPTAPTKDGRYASRCPSTTGLLLARPPRVAGGWSAAGVGSSWAGLSSWTRGASLAYGRQTAPHTRTSRWSSPAREQPGAASRRRGRRTWRARAGVSPHAARSGSAPAGTPRRTSTRNRFSDDPGAPGDGWNGGRLPVGSGRLAIAMGVTRGRRYASSYAAASRRLSSSSWRRSTWCRCCSRGRPPPSATSAPRGSCSPRGCTLSSRRRPSRRASSIFDCRI